MLQSSGSASVPQPPAGDVTALTPPSPGRTEIGEYSHTETLMAGRTKRLAKAAVALAASALVQKAVEKAVKSPKVRRKATELKKVAAKRARVTGKAVRKAAGKQVKRLVKAAR